MIKQLTRGSLILSDDFVQALSYTKPAQITSFALLNLPAWNAQGMMIDAAELGLPAGTIDPNTILPAVFAQYWQNLCAHARQLHASESEGLVVEDFAEQAFWKTLVRLMPDNTDLSRYIVAKSSDVIVSAATIEGNLFTEVMLSVASTMHLQKATMTTGQVPNYLSTTGRLPSSDMAFILGGQDIALYDKNKNYYDIANELCMRASFIDTENVEFNYNALLLYYSINDIEQVAGIYFPDKFYATNNGYELPTIAKRSDISLGYTINLKYAGGDIVEYTATNADSGLAMQVYDNWYRAFTAANMQLVRLNNVVAEQGQDIARLRSIIDGGLFAKQANELEQVKALIQTTFKGSVSTNKLLELFTQAKQNNGQLSLTMVMSDLSKTLTGKDIKVGKPCGSYDIGDTIYAGTSITDVLQRMLQASAPVLYTYPTGELSYNGSTGRIFLPIESISSFDADLILAINDGGRFITPAQAQITEEGRLTTVNVQPGSRALQYQLMSTFDNIIVVKCIVQYTEGAIKPEDSDGSEHVYAGLLNLQLEFVPLFNAYVGSLQNLESLPNLTGDDVLRNFRLVPSNTLQPVYGGGTDDVQVLCIPSKCNNPLTSTIADVVTMTINGMQYKAYAVHDRYMTIDTTNLI